MSNHSTRTTYPSSSFRSVIDEIRIEKRISELPDNCSLFLAGLFNLENDAAPLFDGIPYSVVMGAATRDQSVRCAAERLLQQYPNYWQNR